MNLKYLHPRYSRNLCIITTISNPILIARINMAHYYSTLSNAFTFHHSQLLVTKSKGKEIFLMADMSF